MHLNHYMNCSLNWLISHIAILYKTTSSISLQRYKSLREKTSLAMASNEDKATTPPAGLLETIQLEHVPSTHTVHIAAFKDVTNAEFLQQQLLSRNAEFEYAFIDASSVRKLS